MTYLDRVVARKAVHHGYLPFKSPQLGFAWLSGASLGSLVRIWKETRDVR